MEVRLQLLVKATFFLLFLLKGQFQDIFDPCVSMVMDLVYYCIFNEITRGDASVLGRFLACETHS